MYRYVSERMRHELQNSLIGPKTRLIQIRTILDQLDKGLARSELEDVLLKLRDEFQVLGRMAEFEPNDDYFALRPIKLCEWVQAMNSEYGQQL